MHDIAPCGSVASAKSDAEAQAGCDKHGRGMHQLFKVRKSHNIENGPNVKGLRTVLAMNIRVTVLDRTL